VLTLLALGTIETLRHHKKDVDEIKKGMECGLSLDNHSDIQPGDFLQIYTIIEKRGVL
jgi:translation initiation factor IF-2